MNNKEKIEQIQKTALEDILDLQEYKALKPFLYKGRENAIPLTEHFSELENKGVSIDIINALAEKLCLYGNIEKGFYLPSDSDFEYETALKSAEKNVLDENVRKYIRSLESIEEIQDFQAEISEFAIKQKHKKDLTDLVKTAITQLKKRIREYEQAERMEKYRQQRSRRESRLPDWAYLDNKDRPRIDERLYIEHLINECGEVRCWNGKLRTLKGLFRDNEALNLIQNEISQVINYKIANTACDILKALKNRCYCEEPPLDRKHIYFQNGTLKVDDKGLFTVFSEQKEFCRNRLLTNYNPNAPEPKMFLKYMNDLYTSEQIRTIKQYLGYCFIPTNRLQICLHIYGLGGSGKSQLGGIMAKIFGEENSTIDKISKLGKTFGAANIENKLLFIDDDVTEQALERTEFFKSIVTAPDDVKQEFEAKYKQENRIMPYSRFLTFGNFTFRSLYDNTDGFYRRILVLECKPAPVDRQKIKNLDEKIFRSEAESIVKWCVEGLNDLIQNDWELYISDSVKTHSDNLKYSDDSVEQYITESGNVCRGAGYRIATCDLFQDYCQFCEDNSLIAVKQRTFAQTLKERVGKYKINPTNHTNKIRDNREVRGFVGIALKNTDNIY